MTARELVFELLLKAEKSNQYSNIALDNALKQTELSSTDKGLVSAIFYGVIERRITLDYQIKALSSRELNVMTQILPLLFRRFNADFKPLFNTSNSSLTSILIA